MTRRKSFLPIVAGAAMLLGAFGVVPVAAATCTESAVHALAEAPLTPDKIAANSPATPKIVEALASCRYGFYKDGATATFTAGEPFLGANIWFSDYKASGVSRKAAVADIDATVDHVRLAKVQPDGSLGPWIEQVLSSTAVRQTTTNAFGIIVYQQRYFIGRLDAGDYVSSWDSTFYGEPDSTATTYLHIVPGP